MEKHFAGIAALGGLHVGRAIVAQLDDAAQSLVMVKADAFKVGDRVRFTRDTEGNAYNVELDHYEVKAVCVMIANGADRREGMMLTCELRYLPIAVIPMGWSVAADGVADDLSESFDFAQEWRTWRDATDELQKWDAAMRIQEMANASILQWGEYNGELRADGEKESKVCVDCGEALDEDGECENRKCFLFSGSDTEPDLKEVERRLGL